MTDVLNDLQYQLERAIVIRAMPETVFRFFTDNARWASWWGAGSTIDPRPGGRVFIRYPNGVEGSGEIVSIHAPEEIVFTYGYASGKPIPPGSSRISIHLEPHAAGTRLHLRHEFAEAAARDEHVQGWRFQLSQFSNAVTSEANARASEIIDAWYTAWAITDEQMRAEAFARISTPGILFRDRFSLLEGTEDLVAHTGAALRFMPGIRLERTGDVRHCQGTALADWIAAGKDGVARMTGTSVFEFAPDGRIASATGFTNPAPAA